MKELISLYQLIAAQRVDHINVFNKKKRKGKTWMLYNAIINGEIKDDKQGIKKYTKIRKST